jgi:predicted neutral ceramidase superfamily lipid hydrolase
MYRFSLTDSGSGLELTITRALLALAGFTSFVVQNGYLYIVNIAAGIALLLAAITVKSILARVKINRPMFLVFASVILFVATGSLIFGIVLLLFGLSTKFLIKESMIEITQTGITLPKMWAATHHSWSEFNNVVLKDGLLTLDFRNNKLIQLAVSEVDLPPEQSFNEFCRSQIGPALVPAS